MEGSGRPVPAKGLNILSYVQAFGSQQPVVSLRGAAHLVPVFRSLELYAPVLWCWRGGEYNGRVGGGLKRCYTMPHDVTRPRERDVGTKPKASSVPRTS